MARDVTDLLREALPEHVGEPDLDRIDQRVRRRRAGRIGAAATAAAGLVVAAALGVGTARSPEIEIVDEPPTSPSVEPSPSASPTDAGAAAEVVVLPEPTPIGVHQVADLPGDGFVLETDRGLVLVAADLSATWELPELVLDAWPAWVEGAQVEGTSPTEVGAIDPWVVDVGPFPVVDTASTPGARWWVTPGGGFVERVGVEWVDLVAGAWMLEDVDTTPGERRRVFVGAGDDIEVLASFDETVPVAVSSDRRFVTSLVDGERPFADVDMGGVGETDPGCWLAAGLGDFAGLEICDDGATLRAFGPDGDDEVLATSGDLADTGVVRFVGAAYTDGGVLVQSETDDGDGRVHLIGDTGPIDLGPGRLLSGRSGVDTSAGAVAQGAARIALFVPTGATTHELRLVDPAAPTDDAATTVVALPDDASITDARVYRFGHLWADRAAGPGAGG